MPVVLEDYNPNGFRAGDRVMAIEDDDNNSPFEANSCGAILGEYYYLLTEAMSGGAVSRTQGGEPIARSFLGYENMGMIDGEDYRHEVTVKYKDSGIKLKERVLHVPRRK